MASAVNKSRLLWACRRGMLELDVLFGPFVHEAYDGLPESDKIQFERLLTCEDPELFSWFMGHASCPDPELAKIVDIVLHRVKV